MSLPSTGAQHYVLLLIPALLRELERLGVGTIVAKSGLPEQEVTRLYFQGRALSRILPKRPASLEPALWSELLLWVRALSTLVSLATQDQLEQAREQAVSQYLPHARENLAQEVARQRQEGDIDFHLAGMIRDDHASDHAEEICMEALRLEREQRFGSLKDMPLTGLSCHQLAVVRAARAYASLGMANPPENFSLLDLVIRLLDLFSTEMKEVMAQDREPESDSTIANIVLGLGNLLFREELGLASPVVGPVR